MGVLPSNFFSISTSPASASFERWLERLPLVSPVMFRRNKKSALSHADSATRIASRAGSWTRRFSDCRYSNGVGMPGSSPVGKKPFEHDRHARRAHEHREGARGIRIPCQERERGGAREI